MATEFQSTASLLADLEDASFDRPPAIVSNAHYTGLAVSRALEALDVPVVALDRTGDGVAPPSTAVDYAGRITYPLEDADGFESDLEAVVDAVGSEVVAFPCMDEWVHAYAGADVDGVRRPFSGPAGIERVLDKESLYAVAEALGVPYPETYRLRETDPEEAADALGFPLVVKPARKREGEEALGTNVIEVEDEEAFAEIVAAAEDADVRIMAQERVNVAPGEDCSVGSYVPPSGVGDALSVVGNPRLRYPRAYGSSCAVERVERPELEERAFDVLAETGYHGISEAEFVYDADRGEYVLLDVNTRPWKWIGMPVEAGANLPAAAYAAVTEAEYEPEPFREALWVALKEYVSALATDDSTPAVLDGTHWRALASGSFERSDGGLTTAVYRPSDPGPTAKLLETEFSGREYYCAC
ncbi:carboxylate--amine ligase [Natronobeatus ordinarius]|uniref:carboxylate--amine ligase n=1 Tax=Natronobeatus ordinarius TaxID=2963433 RepID=UPI0020CCCBDC|nr:carboxylate--amine ligase [Natronobeatus ordinarius]